MRSIWIIKARPDRRRAPKLLQRHSYRLRGRSRRTPAASQVLGWPPQPETKHAWPSERSCSPARRGPRSPGQTSQPRRQRTVSPPPRRERRRTKRTRQRGLKTTRPRQLRGGTGPGRRRRQRARPGSREQGWLPRGRHRSAWRRAGVIADEQEPPRTDREDSRSVQQPENRLRRQRLQPRRGPN